MNHSHRRTTPSIPQTKATHNNSLGSPQEMVQVRKKPDKLEIFVQQFTPARHLFNLLLLAVIGLLACMFMILQAKEVRQCVLVGILSCE